MIDTSFYTWLTANAHGYIVQENKIDFDQSLPWIWFKRASTIQERFLGGATRNLFTTEFDVEVISADIDGVQSMADTIKTALQNISPASVVGSTYCMGIFVNEHTDDYISKVILNNDTGLHRATFSVRIFHRG